MTSRPFLSGQVGLVLDDAVDAAWCEAQISDLEQRGFAATGEAYPRAYRDNDRRVLDDPALAAWLFERVRARLPASLPGGWRLAGLNPRFRACRYRDGQAFCVHRDGAHVGSDEVRSHLTLQIYLDDDPARRGGRTRFYRDAAGAHLVASIAPRRGTAIVFDHRAWHDGEAVSVGVKHVLRTDVMYRRTAHAEPEAGGHVLGHHRGYAWRAIACRDGSVASAGRDGTVRRWRSDGPARCHELGHGSITALVEGRDARLWCGTRSGRILDALNARPELEQDKPAPAGGTVAMELGAVLGATLDARGPVFATARGTLVAFGADGAQRWTTVAHEGWAWTVIGHASGVLSCGEDGRIAATDESGRTRTLAELGTPARALVALPSGELVVGDTRGWLHRLGADGVAVQTWRAHDAAITCLVHLPDGAIASSSEDGRVIRWHGYRAVTTLRADDFVTSLDVDPAGRLVCAGYDGAIWRA